MQLVQRWSARVGALGARREARRSARRDAPRPRRTWGQRLGITLGCLSTVGLLASSAGLTYLFRKYERVQRIELGGLLDETDEPGEPENYLLVGVDNASDLPADDTVRIGRDPSDNRSDTIMILRTDPASGRAALLSLPRDILVTLPDTGGQGRINLAFRRGGTELLIKTIRHNFGIPINHYVEVDFSSFRGLVDAVDGVPVPIPRPARDDNTGLDIKEAGCHTLDPVEALAYVRSRHYYELIDGEWELDQRSDLGRVARQQDFIRRALTRAIDGGARNPGTLDQLIDVGLEGITIDEKLTADDILDLGLRFRSFDPENLTMYSLSGTPDVVGGADILRLDEGAETEATLDIFRGGPAELSPASVQVTVHNGTGAPQQGTEATAALRAAGFAAEVAADELGAGAQGTIVRYPPGREVEADLVARWLVGDARLVEVAETTGAAAGVEVVTGTDWQGVRDEARASTSTSSSTTLPEATSSTTSTTASSTASSGDGSEATTSSSGQTTTTVDLAAIDC